MAEESKIIEHVKLTALPNGFASPNRLKLSVFVTPEITLSPDPTEENYVPVKGTTFENWATFVNDVNFTVVFREEGKPDSQPIPADKSKHVLNDNLWRKLFAGIEALIEPATKSASFAALGDNLNTFPVYDVHQVISEIYTGVVKQSAAAYVQLSSNFRAGNQNFGPPIVPLPDMASLLDSKEAFGRIFAPPPATSTLSNPLQPMPKAKDQKKFEDVVNFHDRRWRPEPPPKDERDRLKQEDRRRQLEFHRRVAQVAEYPAILRQLGLVFDLEFDLKVQSKGVVWVSWDKAGIDFTLPRTRYDIDINSKRFAAAPSEKSSEPPLGLRDGMLTLNDTKLYNVIQLDVDGAALSSYDFAANLYRTATSISTDKPEGLAPPSMRTSGISIVRCERAKLVAAELNRPMMLQSMRLNNEEIYLDAEQLVRGYRIDVWASGKNKGQWRPLCAREIKFEVPGVDVGSISDEGHVSLGITHEDSPTGKKAFAHESIFLWNGWSPVAPRPEKMIDSNGKPADLKPNDANDTPLPAKVKPKHGLLTPLRFGFRYRMRARAVDLAGNDMAKAEVGEFENASEELTYRRFEPVGSPVLIARTDPKKLPGESLDHLVIRSNYDRGTSHTSERHVAPPKSSVLMAELHGRLDISQAPSELKYEIARREGEFAKEGVHPEEQLILPYLADPLAIGVAVHQAPGTNETIKIQFDGGWPDLIPFRIVLSETEGPPHCDKSGGNLHVKLPKATIIKLQISSLMNRDDLKLMALWEGNKLGQITALTIQEAASGQFWLLTPPRELTLMHAVQQPLKEPRLTIQSDGEKNDQRIVIARDFGQTSAEIRGNIGFDARSTGKIDLTGEWTEPFDDKHKTSPGEIPGSLHTFDRIINYLDPDVIEFPVKPLPSAEDSKSNHARLRFGDTKYRRVTCRATATTRFLEQFFTPEQIRDGIDTQKTSVVRETPIEERQIVHVLNCARPDAPKIRYVIPLFGWTEPQRTKDKKAKTETLTHERKGGGLRVYLDRPWHSSGEGELLGVVLWPGAAEYLKTNLLTRAAASVGLTDPPREFPNQIKSYVSQWGMDPIRISNPLDKFLGAESFFNAEPQRLDSSGARQKFTLEELIPKDGSLYNQDYLVHVAGYKTHFDSDRQLWYCDIEMDTGDAYFPFVRLALARFQPNSVIRKDANSRILRDCHLSRVEVADFIQLAPGRFLTVVLDRKNPKHIAIKVQGIGYQDSGAKDGPSKIEVSVEERDKETTAGWVQVPGKITSLKPETASNGKETIWRGEIDLDKEVKHSKYRIIIREYESYLADSRQNVSRIVYADKLEI